MKRSYVDPLLKSNIITWINENKELFIEKGATVLGKAVNAEFDSDIKHNILSYWAKTIKIHIGRPKKIKPEVPSPDETQDDDQQDTLDFHKNWLFKHHYKIEKLERRVRGLRRSRKRLIQEVIALQENQKDQEDLLSDYRLKINVNLKAIEKLYKVLGEPQLDFFEKLTKDTGSAELD